MINVEKRLYKRGKLVANTEKSRSKKRNSKRKKIFIGIGAVLALIILLVALFIGKLAYEYSQAYEEVEVTREVDTDALEPVSVLLMGIDSRGELEEGRSDTMIVVTINPEKGETTMLSIPRDAYVYIEDYGYDKINHAYAYGGAELAIETVENFLDIPIDYFVCMDFEGFVSLVDALGGVTVYNEFEFSCGESYFPEGELHLNGQEALDYCRMRYEDPEGDAGRQKRQQEVILGLVEQAKQIDSVSDITAIFEVVGDHMSTNITPQEIWDMMWDYAPALQNVTNLQLPFDGFTGEDGVYYAEIDDEVRVLVSNELRESLGLEVRDRQYYIDEGYDISLEEPVVEDNPDTDFDESTLTSTDESTE